ncbi:MAG: hypothetical protein V3S76_01280 [Candidatus Bipolaricaulota bacterium]
MKRIESRGTQAFNVPNDQEGHEFLRLLRKFSHGGTAYRARSRGPRKRPGDARVSFSRALSIPQSEAEWFAVYMGFNENDRFSTITRLSTPESHQLWRLRNGFYPHNPLNYGEKTLLTHAVHSFIDDHAFVMQEGELDKMEDIIGKLDLDK